MFKVADETADVAAAVTTAGETSTPTVWRKKRKTAAKKRTAATNDRG